MEMPESASELAACDVTERPVVTNQNAPGSLAIGDYVFASRWGDCDPGDPWVVGHISELGADFVVIGEVNKRRWPRAMLITHEQGRRIVEQYPLLEENWRPRNFEEIARVFGIQK